MKKLITSILASVITVLIAAQPVENTTYSKQTTICNPMNLSYRFCIDDPSRREAADPTVVMFKDEYYLFASKSGGYWHSTDLVDWKLITTPYLPFEDYAPTVVVMNDTLYYMISSSNKVKIYKSGNPKSGRWEIAHDEFPIVVWDPALFLDDDGRLYLYWGCSNKEPIRGVELDVKTLNPIGTPVVCFNSDKVNYGWERMGDYNELADSPWMEGAWMNKYNGKYYLQYAAPGTIYKSYNDGVYIGDSPLGPFKLAQHNPFSLKPEGFACGAGHGSTFEDKYGNYWHIGTVCISVRQRYERRLALFPAFFDEDGVLYAYTGFGDFPFTIPQKKISGPAELFSQWMLLSYNKPVEVSSELPNHPKKNANDEEIRTWWSAKTGNKGEWINMDLQKKCTINAVQLNFAENKTKLHDRSAEMYFQYLLEYSNDNKIWTVLEDKTLNRTDVPHDYIQLSKPIKARYIRLTNYHVPDGTFAMAGLRVFGTGGGAAPKAVENLTVTRSQTDRCVVDLKWNKNPEAVGYNVRYGSQADKLYHNYQVLGTDTLTIRNLNGLQKYYFTIDAFNENGVKKGTKTIETE